MRSDVIDLVRAVAAVPFVLLGWLFIVLLQFCNFCAVVVAGNIVVEEE